MEIPGPRGGVVWDGGRGGVRGLVQMADVTPYITPSPNKISCGQCGTSCSSRFFVVVRRDVARKG